MDARLTRRFSSFNFVEARPPPKKVATPAGVFALELAHTRRHIRWVVGDKTLAPSRAHIL